MDIYLINIGGTKKKVYQELSKEFSACEPPFWAALTAGYLRQHGLTASILDASGLNLDMAETIEAIRIAAPRFVGIVVYSQQANCSSPIMVAVEALAKMIKQLLPEQKLVISGWHPSTLPARTLQDTGADYVVQGEGFRTLRELLEGGDTTRIAGLWHWNAGKVQAPPSKAENIRDLSSELDDVAWDLIPWDNAAYRAFNWMCLADFSQRNHYVSMFTSLGCPYSCSFCAIHATYGEHRIRYWSPEWVLKQFDTLHRRYGVYHVNLIDELFVFNREHYLPIAEGLLQREYKLNICAFVRVDTVARMPFEELQLLKRAGFNWFKIGIESPSRNVLDNVNKGKYTKDDIRNVVDKIHRAGIDMCANFIFGLPGDNYDSMQENFSFAMELNPVFPSFFCAMAVPGSELYDVALRNQWALPDNWLGYAQQAYEFLPLPTQHLSAAQVLEFRDYAFKAYYDNPRYLNMIEAKFGRVAREHITSMNQIKLKRVLLGD